MAATTATASAGLSTTLNGSYSVSILGVVVLSLSPNLTNVNINPEQCADFINETKDTVVVVVPVTATATVTGCVGLNLYGTAAYTNSQSTISFTGEPYVNSTLSLSAGVGVDGFSTGAEGSLELLTVSTPVTMSLSYVPSTNVLSYGIDSGSR